MDISAYVAIGTALIGALSNVIVQVSKRYIPKDYRGLYAVGVAVILALLSLALGGNPVQGGASISVVVLGVIGISQALYAALKPILGPTENADPPSE